MKKLIIIEGMDNTGKSTLVKKLSSYLPHHEVVVSPGPCANHVQWCIDELNRTDNRIYDRFPVFSETVYGNIIRGYSTLNNYLDQLLSMLVDTNPLIIYCDPGLEVIRGTFHEREQMAGVKENDAKCLDAYRNLMKTTQKILGTDNVIYYDFTEDPDAQRILDRLEEHYNEY